MAPSTKKRGPGRPRKNPAPDPEVAAAAERVIGDEGADKSTPKSAAERMREHRARKKAESEPKPVVWDEGDEAVAGTLFATVWDIAAPFTRSRPLTDGQTQRIGKAGAPLVAKYLPLLADWQYEAAFGLTLLAIIKETRIPADELAAKREEANAARVASAEIPPVRAPETEGGPHGDGAGDPVGN